MENRGPACPDKGLPEPQVEQIQSGETRRGLVGRRKRIGLPAMSTSICSEMLRPDLQRQAAIDCIYDAYFILLTILYTILLLDIVAILREISDTEVPMSDGPHRSLPMRAPWRAFAEEASSHASSISDVMPKLVRAVESDWRAEVSSQLLSELHELAAFAEAGSLFPDAVASELDRMKQAYPGESLALVFIECVGQALGSGLLGPAAVEDGTRRVLDLRITRGFRHVEEHYYRRASRGDAQHVRARLAQAAAAFDSAAQSRAMFQRPPRRMSSRPRKRSGIDEGVPL